MNKKAIDQKPDAPYSPAVICGEMIFVSGQVPIDPQSGKIVSDDFREQAEQIFANLKSVLERSGSSLDKIVKTTAFLTSMDDFGVLNEVYKKHFLKDRPARSCVEVCALPFGAKVEIEAIALS